MRKNVYHPDVLNLLRILATFFVFLLHGRSHIEGINDSSNPLMFLTVTPAWAGVWIFIIISSYLLGNGFVKGKYPIYNKTGKLSVLLLIQFYIKRWIRLAPIYYLYCFLFEYFTEHTFLWNNPKIALKILTFTFNGNGGISGIGHLWYLSLAMQIYMIIPLIYIILCRLKKVLVYKILFAIVLGLGLTLRLILYHYQVSWYTWVYTFIGSNLDIVICGVLLAFINNDIKRLPKKSFVLEFLYKVQFIFLILYNCYIYYLGMKENIFIYQYILPTLYILSCSILILKYHNVSGIKRELSEKFHLLKFIDWFAPYTFAFYILHIQMFNYFDLSIGTLNLYTSGTLLYRYIMFFGSTFILTLLGSIILKCAVDGITAKVNSLIHF